MSLQTRLASLITAVGADVKALTLGTMTNILGGKEKTAAASGTSGTVTLDLSAASIFTLTPTAAVTTLAITNVPASGFGVSVRLKVTWGATPYAIAAPSGGIFYSAGTPTPVASKKAMYDFFTLDGGTSWDCSGVVQV